MPYPNAARSLVAAAAALLLAACAHAQASASCGTLIPNTAAHCANPDKPAKAPCCDAIRALKELNCWCDVATHSTLRYIATNAHGFAARFHACNITRPFMPSLPPPHRKVRAPPATCPEWPKVEVHPQCPKNLVNARLDSLKRLDALALKQNAAPALDAFREALERLLSPDVVFSNVGQASFVGRQPTTDYLLARQASLGAVLPLFPPKKRASAVQWRGDTASYVLEVPVPGNSLATERSVWVTFGICSATIVAFTAAESAFVSSQYEQFYYPEPKGKTGMDPFDGVESKLCTAIQSACKGKNSVYPSTAACQKAVNAIKSDGRVMCNALKTNYVPQLAMHGDSLACRSLFSTAALVAPDRYCSWLGPVGKGACVKSACPSDLYDDIFAMVGEARVSGSGGSFSCNKTSGLCIENWPHSFVLEPPVLGEQTVHDIPDIEFPR